MTKPWFLMLANVLLVLLVQGCSPLFAPSRTSDLSFYLGNSTSARNFVSGDNLTIRLVGTQTITHGPIVLPTGQDSFQVSIPQIPLGTYQIEATIRGNQGQIVLQGSTEANLTQEVETLRLSLEAPREITEFSINGVAGIFSFDDGLDFIYLTLPQDTYLGELGPEITWQGRSISPNTPKLDFSSTVTYTITGADGLTRDYLVVVSTEQGPIEDPRELISFSILGYEGSIVTPTTGSGTVYVEVPYDTNRGALTPQANYFGASISPNTYPLDFTNPVTFTITASDGQTRDYVVTVELAPAPYTKDLLVGSIGGYYTFGMGDIDNSGTTDLLIDNGLNDLKVYTGSVARDFAVIQTLNTNGKYIYGVGAGDLNNDGYQEVLTAGPNGANDSHNALYTNSAGTLTITGQNTNALNPGTYFYGWSVVTDPINGDTYHDAVWWESGKVWLGLSDGLGEFSSFTNFNMHTDGSEYGGLRTEDVDGDGDIDILAGKYYNGVGNGSISIFLNDGSGDFTLLSINQANQSATFPTYFNPHSLTSGDYDGDGDGDVDLAFFNRSSDGKDPNQGLWYALRTSTDGLSPTYSFNKVTNNFIDNGNVAAHSLDSGDWDNDGNDDLLVSQLASMGLFILMGDASSPLIERFHLKTAMTNKARFGDFDGDENLDVVFRIGTQITVFYQ